MLLERSDEADNDLMEEYELEQMMAQQLEEEQAEEVTEPSSAYAADLINVPDPEGISKPAEPANRDRTGSADLLEATMKKAADLKAARATADEGFALPVFYCERAMPRATVKRQPCSADRQRQIRSSRPGGARRKCVHMQREMKWLGWYQ